MPLLFLATVITQCRGSERALQANLELLQVKFIDKIPVRWNGVFLVVLPLGNTSLFRDSALGEFFYCRRGIQITASNLHVREPLSTPYEAAQSLLTSLWQDILADMQAAGSRADSRCFRMSMSCIRGTSEGVHQQMILDLSHTQPKSEACHDELEPWYGPAFSNLGSACRGTWHSDSSSRPLQF